MKTYEIYSGKRGDGSRDRSVDDIERDLGNIRAEMSSTLRAIESKLSGGDVVGQLIGQLRGGGAESSELLRNVASVARANPVPVALIVTGLGAMLFAGSEGTSAIGGRVRQQARDRVERYRTERDSRMEGGESVSERAREAAGEVTERARGIRESAEERLQHAREGASRRMQDVSGRAREQTEQARERIRHGTERARGGLRTASQQGRRVVEDEPLVLVGLGLAAGAALAASIPLMQEGRERYRRAQSEAEQREHEQRAEGFQQVEIVSEASTGIEWQEEPRIGPDVSRPEYPEDDSTTYR